jgi:acetyl esterase/lipase
MRTQAWRTGLGLALAVPALAAALLLAASPPTFATWVLHLVSLELSLAIAAAALLALAVTVSLPGRGASVVRLAAVPALVIGLIPALVLVPLYRAHGAAFSPLAYPPFRPVAAPSRRDVVLEPSRPDLKTDVYLPDGPGPHPFVVVIHSGAWRSGDKGENPDASWAIAHAGHVVLDVEYRLSAEGRFPAAVADVKCLLGRARERAAELHMDPDRGAYLGRSAGGEIALVAAYSAGDPRVAPACAVEDRPVTSVVSLYGPTDLAWGYVTLVRPDVVTGSRALDLYLGGPPAQYPEAYRLASPVSWVDRPLPRTLLVHGTGDRLVSVENERRLAQALRAAGRSVDVLELPLADHGFDVHAGGLAEQLARHVLLRFLAADQDGAAARR